MPPPDFTYDVVAYPSHPLPQTHPARLAAIGTLCGMTPAPVDRCRVLELGGGDGSNTIPLGLIYPESSFLGVDLAVSAVAQGNEIVAELGLANVTLQTGDLLDLPGSLGTFDYIIAHGLFSWVPPLVREKILSICRAHLAPHGIAYISYNALPGCHIRRMARDMMRYHVRHIAQPAAKIEQAVAFMHFLAQGKAKQQDAYAMVVRDELKGMTEKRDQAVLFHDDLADVNQPYYFHEFMALAAARDLQFLGEADFFESSDCLFPPEVSSFLDEIGKHDPLEREQYLDFLKCRRFRQTLLVRKQVALDRQAAPERVRDLAISSRAKPDPATVDLRPGVRASFREATGAAITIDLPFPKAALLYLGATYPQPAGFAALVAEAERQVGRSASADEIGVLTQILSTAFAIGLVELQAGPPTFVRQPGEKPLVSPLARLQLARGQTIVTSLRHSPVQVPNALSRQLILLLDGRRDRPALLEELVAWAAANPAPNQPSPSRDELRKILADQLEPGLQSVAAMGLLMA